MKKFIICFSALALISSCAKVEVTEPVQDDLSNDSAALYADLPKVIYASVSDESGDSQTRTFVDGKSVKWHRGESISYYAGEYGNVKYTMKGDQPDGTVSAEFVKDGEANYAFGEGDYSEKPNYSLAVYPYDETQKAEFSEGGYDVHIKFAKEQTYARNSFGKGANIMVATGSSNDDENLYFRHACGYLVIKLYGTDTKVSNITLTALGEGVKISGEATLRVEQNQTVAFDEFNEEAAYNTIILDCSNGGQGVALGADAGNATEFWFALPPVTIEGGLEITVTDTEGYTFTKQTTKNVPITRRDIQPMAALEFTTNTQTPVEQVDNRITYTTKNNEEFIFRYGKPFDANITAHYYDNSTQKFIIECDAPIKVINDKAFRRLVGDVSLTSVSLPSQLETIGEYAFHFNNLQELVIPGSVTMIKDHAFRENRLKRLTFLCGDEDLEIRDCDNISPAESNGAFREAFFDYIYIDRNIRFKDDLGGEYAYVDDMSMFAHSGDGTYEVEFGSNVTTITGSMFYGSEIKKLVIPGNITHIEQNAFVGNNSLEELVFLPNPDGTPLTIDCGEILGIAGPFYVSTGTGDKLKTIRLNREINYTLDVIDSARKGIFSGRKVLETIEIGEQVRTLYNYMFASSDVLSSVTLPESVTSIGKYAFSDCTALTSINIPSQVTLIDEGTFDNCEALPSITIPSGITSIGKYAFRDCEVLSSISIPSNVQTIGESAFENCIDLTTITVPSMVNTIGESAFEDCDGLIYATINSSTLGSYMFYGCDNLASVTIGGTLDAINVDAFSGCSKLSILNISGSVGTIGNGAFDGFNLTSLNISGYVGTIGANAFDDNDKMTSFTVTGSVGTIGKSAFEDSDALATVNITGTVDRVCECAFSDCDAVETLAIRANTVEAYAYEDMDGLKTATLYGTTVGDGVFQYCDYLEELIIDGGVNSIGNDAFYDCPRLASVTFEGSTTNLRLGYQPGTNDRGPFYDSPLTYINLNRQIDYIYDNLDSEDEGVFANANTSTPATVVFGENVRAIHNWMFYGVPVSELTIPAGINAIGKEAFGNNSHLTKVTCEGSTPAKLDSEPFTSTNLQAIKVPSGSIDLYKINWSRYQLYLRGY